MTMTTMKCPKCGLDHEVDPSKIGWSVTCESCRPAWGTSQRSWMRLKHKEMVKKRTREIKGSKR